MTVRFSRAMAAAWLVGAMLLVNAAASHGQLTAKNVMVTQAGDLPGHGTRTTYSLSNGADHAELILERSGDPRLKPELRFNVWQGDVQSHAASPALPIERRLGYFRPLMERLLATEKPEPAYGLLFYGYTELNDRMPELAARDAGWDRRTGGPVRKSVGYGYLQDLLSRGGAYRELAEATASVHYGTRIDGGMEELRVLPVSKLTDSQRSHLPADVKPGDLLPARVAIDFTLTKDK